MCIRDRDQGSALAPETPEALQEGAAQPEEKTAEELYDESFKTLREGDIVKGKVMSVDENGALVDVGYKSEGVISAQELERRGVIGSFELSPGDEIMVYVLSVESGEGSLRLSKRKADEEAAWKNLEQAYSCLLYTSCRDGDLIEIIAERGQANVCVSAASGNILGPQVGTWVKGEGILLLGRVKLAED